MALTFSNQAVIAFKNLSGKSNTDVDKFLGNEAEGIFQNVDFSKVWTNIVGPTPSITVGSGFAIFVTASLVVDSTSNGHAYFALWPTSAPSGIDPSTSLPYSYGSGLLSNISSSNLYPTWSTASTAARVIDSIPSSYGYLYEAKPFDNTSSAISVGDPRDWVYQYQSGIFFQQDNVGNVPASIALYAYTGNTLQEELGSLGVGSITGITAGNGLSGGGTQGFINLDVNLLSSGGLTFSGDDIAVDYSTLSYQLSGNGLTANGGTLSVNLGINGGLTYSGGTVVASVDGTTIQIIDGYLVSTTEGDISGVTAGAGLSGGGTQGFVTLDVNLGINSGLTFSGDDISVDYSTLSSQLAGIGLTSNGGILSSDLLINGGLTYSGNQIGVYVDGTTIQIIDGYLVSTTEGDISGVTAGNGLSGGGTQGFVTLDVNLLSLGGLTFSGNDIAVDYSTLASQLSGIGLTSNGGTLSSDLLINGGLTYSGNQIGVYVDGTTIQIIDGYLVSTTEGDISGVTAGDGLSGGGTQGFVTLDVNTGLGLTISNDDVAMVWGGTSSGLTFSNNAISIVVDGTSLVINSLGELSVVSGSSTPVYQYGNPTASTGDGSQTGITLSFTPNKYSRIEVFVNGQKQRVGDDMTVDCYFSSGLLPSPLNTLSSGDQLFWNGVTSGFQLSSIDVVEITYES
jgi:hypothetical protein